ncbi:hypothetical protein AX14_002191 [Amanita brunnescens Koide BX004]|nr:hypothetical protein AX14_002191 [Amanita brunnescens Koide BX004]
MASGWRRYLVMPLYNLELNALQNYGSINSCVQAAPVLANISMVLFNPGAFIDVIKCACTDTFQAAFPQCVDCFIQTNQTDVLNTPNLPSLVDNIRTVCSFTSTVLSNKTTSSSVPAPTQTSGAVAGIHFEVTMFVGGLIALVALFS